MPTEQYNTYRIYSIIGPAQYPVGAQYLFEAHPILKINLRTSKINSRTLRINF